MKFVFIPDSHIFTAAESLRVEALGKKAYEIPVDLDAILYDYLCEEDDLSVDDAADLHDEDGETVLGKTTMRPGKIEVNRLLKSDAGRGRYRFTLAHEIGHWVLHRAQVLSAGDQQSLFGHAPPMHVRTLNRPFDQPGSPTEEVQANRFASALLIDRRILRKQTELRFGRNGLHEFLRQFGMLPELDLARAAASHRASDGLNLAEAFDVSIEAMAIALKSRRYINTLPDMF